MTVDARPAPAGARRRRRRSRPRVTVVGVLGELLITAGVLVLLFIAWQQWFNDLVVADEHRDQASQLSQQLEQQSAEAPPATTDPAGDPPVTAAPADGQAFGNLYVPRFGADYAVPIGGGTSTVRTLNKIGIGHYDETQMPGEVGNFGIAAHRTTYGAPFNAVADLRPGDEIVVQTADGWYTYRFRNLQYVQATQVSVLQPVPDAPDVTAASGERLITLTSCNPMFSARERIVAYGVFDSWQPLADGPPASLAAAGIGG
ncbi:class E sortase [Frigoribacterium faeni]|uniref:class E sortase n=1 Tax=Frigoribacterium faeni TaxID=145483 RepID=UPI00141B94B6|nr:class E sortase [Frigoribacterium faeni]NIJ05594.1 sortase A [Frigoribacterium faeni]